MEPPMPPGQPVATAPRLLRTIKFADLTLPEGALAGAGAFCTVQKGRWMGVEVAVKTNSPGCHDPDAIQVHRERDMCVSVFSMLPWEVEVEVVVVVW